MFGDLELELQWNFKFPHALGVLIHLKMLQIENTHKKFEFEFRKRLI
jgi:hypothetical protein